MVYKKLKRCSHILFAILKRIFQSGKLPKRVDIAPISLISKYPDKTNDPSLFRPIACLHVESKLFWAIIARRVIQFCRSNKYLSGKIQKGFLPEFAGCLEHSSVLTAALLDAKRNKRTIVVSWLDLANAYGAVKHELFIFALRWSTIPEWVISLVKPHYDALFATVITHDWKTNVFPFQIGVFQGCTFSPLLFYIVYLLNSYNVNIFYILLFELY